MEGEDTPDPPDDEAVEAGDVEERAEADQPAEPDGPAPPTWASEQRARAEPVIAPLRRTKQAGGKFADELVADLKEMTAPLWKWWEGQPVLRDRLPRYLAVILCATYFTAFARLVWLRHEHFGSFDYDLGMYDQGIWQLSRGRGFMTVRGMHVFGHHANVGYLLFVPFYWLGIGGPHFLNLVNTAAVVLVALPIFGLATKHLRSAWVGLFLVAAYLLHFSPQWKIQETFHPESLAAPLLMGSLYFASLGRWRAYAICIVGALIWKEDVALATAMIGIAVGLMFRQFKIGALTLVGSAVWFLLATRVLIERFAPAGAVFDSLFGPLGASATDLVHTSVVHPSRLITTIKCHGFYDGKLETLAVPVEGVLCPGPVDLGEINPPPWGLASLMGPYGYLSFLNPQLLVMGVPQHVVNSATTANFTWDLRWHYAMFPYLGALSGSVFAVVKRKRLIVSWMMVLAMLFGVAVTWQRGVGPFTKNHDSGWWPLDDLPVNEAYRDTIDAIDDDARVTASYFLVPHLAHRQHVYTFPNPWRGSNYGAGGTVTPLPNQNTIDDVVVDRTRLNFEDQALFDAIEDSGQFRVESRTRLPPEHGGGEVVHLRRIKDGPPVVPPSASTPPISLPG